MFYNILCWSFAVLNGGDHRFLCCSLNEITIPICCPCSPGTVHLRTTSQLRKSVDYFMHLLKHPCSTMGRNFQSTSRLFHLQEAFKQNKISVLDPHLYELCKVCQDLSHELFGLTSVFVLAHPEHIEHAGVSRNGGGRTSPDGNWAWLGGLCESQCISERQMSCVYVWEQEVIYTQHQQSISVCYSRSVFLTYCPYLYYYTLLFFPCSHHNPFVSNP